MRERQLYNLQFFNGLIKTFSMPYQREQGESIGRAVKKLAKKDIKWQYCNIYDARMSTFICQVINDEFTSADIITEKNKQKAISKGDKYYFDFKQKKAIPL